MARDRLGVLVMTWLAPDEHRLWKELLQRGDADPAIARAFPMSFAPQAWPTRIDAPEPRPITKATKRTKSTPPMTNSPANGIGTEMNEMLTPGIAKWRSM